jgi:zinc protease
MILNRAIAPDSQAIDKFIITQAKTYELSNGIAIHTLEVGSQPVLRMECIIKAGTSREKPEEKMTSYFTLKMLNEGTKNHSAQQINEFFDGFGAFLEFSHGVENINLSVYCLSKHLADLLPVFSEMLTSAIFPEKELETLKNITIQTLQVSAEKNSYLASKHFKENLFGKENVYGKSLNEVDITPVHRGILQDFYRKYIVKQPFDIVLSGDVNEMILKTVQTHFESFSVEKTVSAENYISLPSTKRQAVLIEKEGSLQSSIRIGKLLFNRKNPDYQAFLVLNEILGGYFSSRLMKNIREEKGFTYGINSGLYSLQYEGYLGISTDVQKEFTQQALDEIYKEVKLLQNEPVGEQELEKVKNYMLGAFAGDLNTPFALADRFKTIYFNNLTYDYYESYVKTVKTVSAEKLMEFAQQYLQTDTLLEVVVGEK